MPLTACGEWRPWLARNALEKLAMAILQRLGGPGRTRLVLMAAAMLTAPAAHAQADTVIVVGTLTGEGVECPAMQGDDGALYTLTPRSAIGLVAAGARIRVEGRIAEISLCQQGTTIEVTKVEMAE